MISFSEYMSMCGWTGEEDIELERAFTIVWTRALGPGPSFKEKFKTVERLLCEPHEALRFVLEYASVTGSRDLDPGTILRQLLNTRKSKKL